MHVFRSVINNSKILNNSRDWSPRDIFISTTGLLMSWVNWCCVVFLSFYGWMIWELHCNIKAYIPLRCKILTLGPRVGLDTPTQEVLVGDTNMLVSKNAQICVTPNAKLKICVTPKANPQRESVDYRWHLVFLRWGRRWPCRFHVVCAAISALAT